MDSQGKVKIRLEEKEETPGSQFPKCHKVKLVCEKFPCGFVCVVQESLR